MRELVNLTINFRLEESSTEMERKRNGNEGKKVGLKQSYR